MFSSLFVCLSVCLSVSNFAQSLPSSERICMKFSGSWQRASEQVIKFWWRSGSLPGYRDCFPDSSLLGDTERG